MYSLKSYLRLSTGEQQDYHVTLDVKNTNGVYAVYIDGFSRERLDSEFGACIEIDVSGISKWMADYRHSPYWCRPEFGSDLGDIPDETQCFIYNKEDGQYGVILPVVSEKYKCVLKGADNGKITARIFSLYKDLNACRALAFVYSEGTNPYELLERCVREGLALLNNGCRMRTERRYPEIFEYLGWCSWDAMEIRVNEEDLLKKCQEFKQKNIPVKWAIIDDMWAEVRDFYNVKYDNRSEMFRLMHSSRLYSFKADPMRFPNGLKQCIDKIKECGIAVGMWHPTTGYWRGIDPDGEIFEKYSDLLIYTPDGRYIPSCEQVKAYEFFSAFHDYLYKSGAEFVKIDNQSIINGAYNEIVPIGEAARGYHNAIEASVGQHFDNQMINCMGMASENMWNRSVSPISRCSDDFLPDNREWFSKHIMQCSYNCLVQGQFYYCDWDMWWTDDGQALKNSILRAVSGGPVYVSDKLDRSKRDVIMPLILEDGKILMCDRPAMPTIDCILENPLVSGGLFKLQNICGDSGVIAVFNISEENKEVSGTVSPSDIEGICGDEFAIYEHFSRELKLLKKDESFEIILKNSDEFKLYVVVPMVNGFAPIGRTDKFISPKTIKYVKDGSIELKEIGEYAYVKDRELIIEGKRR